MAREFNCMFLIPAELNGLGFATCGIFRNACLRSESCVGRVKHTKASRQALAETVEIVRRRREREKGSPLTPNTTL